MSKGKKNAKLPSVVSGGWDEALIKEEVTDSNWNVYVTLVTSEHSFAEDHLLLLKKSIEKGQRKKFVLFDKETLLQKANEDLKPVASAGRRGGGGKSKLGSAMQDRPIHAEVCEHIVNALSSAEGVPVSLLARYIKYCLLKKKKADLSAKEGADPGNDQKSTKKGAAAAGKSSKKGKSTPAVEEDAIPLPQKPPTFMKKWGEEDNDTIYINDEPDDGPHCYIILTGFTEVELIQELIAINVNVHCAVRLLSDKCLKEICDEDASKIKAQSDCLKEFWSLLTEMCSSVKVMQNVALIDLCAPRQLVPSCDEEKETYGSEMFTVFAEKLYELLALYTQYTHYINFLNVLHVPFIANLQVVNAFEDKTQEAKDINGSHPSSAAEQLSISRDLNYYNQLLSCIPEESVDIGLILYCLVEQVSLNLSIRTSTCSKSMLVESEQGKKEKLQEMITSLINDLTLGSAEKQELLLSPSTNETTTTTHSVRNQYVFSSHDLLQQKLYHLRSSKQFDIHASSIHTLDCSWFMRLLRSIRQKTMENSLDNASINALENFCITTDISQSDLHHALALLSLENINIPNASVQPYHPMLLQHLAYDHPFSVISNAALQQSVFAPLLSYCVHEYLNDTSVVQQLQTLQQTTHPYMNCFYHNHLKSGVLVVHTGYDGKSLYQYDWLAQSHFPLGFQDYIQYVAKPFGKIVDEAAALEKERIQATLSTANQSQQKEAQGLPSESPLQNSGKNSTGGKKTETSVALSKDLSSSEPTCINAETTKKLFTAYDIGGAPLLCKGLVRTAFTADGSQIQTKTLGFVNKSTTILTAVLDSANRISVYLVFGKKEKVTQPPDPSPGTEGEVAKEETQTFATPTLLSVIPQPINNIIYCGLQATFKDSITVSLSHYGPDGNGDFSLKPDLPKVLKDTNSVSPSRPLSQAAPLPPQKLSKKQLEQQQQMLEDQKRQEEQFKKAQNEYAEKWNTLVTQCKYQQLFASNSYGLHIHCQVFCDPLLDGISSDGENKYVVVRQAYHWKGSGAQNCEQVLLKAAYHERHRCYMPSGSIICFLNQSIVILNADGSSLKTASALEQEQYAKMLSYGRMKSAQTQDAADRLKSATSAISFASDVAHGDDTTMDKSLWVVTTPAGERFFWKDPMSTNVVKTEDSKCNESGDVPPSEDVSEVAAVKLAVIKLSPVRVCRVTDPITKEEIITREDNTMILYQPDGSHITEFADGTRITTSRNGTQTSEVIAECPGYARIHYSFQSSNICTVTFPDLSVIECYTDGSYYVRKADSYKLHINKDGNASYINLHSSKQHYSFSHSGTVDLLQYCDSKGTNFNVDLSGKISVMNEETPTPPMHSNFLPMYFWVPENSSPYILLPESTLQEVISYARSDFRSVVLEDNAQLGCLTSSTILKPCLSGLCQNYQLPYLKDTLFPSNVQGPELNTKCTSASGALQFQHFLSRAPISNAVRQQILQGIAKYISWYEAQEIMSKSLLPDMKQDEETTKLMLSLESKWKDSNSSTLLNTEILHQMYKESMSPKPIYQNDPVKVVLVKPQKQNPDQTEDVRTLLRKNKHPPYFSLYNKPVDTCKISEPIQKSNSKKEMLVLSSHLKLHGTEAQHSNNCYSNYTLGSSEHQILNTKSSNCKLQSKEKCSPATTKMKFRLKAFPEEINFGTIKVPGIYSQTFTVQNNAVRPVRLKIKQTLCGLDEVLLSYTPGPVAAGMSKPITINWTITEHSDNIPDDYKVEINSEAGTLLIPVKGIIGIKS